jgi:hypothetical protein
MKSAMSKNRIQSDILEWSLPEEFLSVLLKDRTTGDFVFSICHTLCDKLSWSHYRTLITVENEAARQYYFEEAVKSKWSVRDLQRQIEPQFYQRLIANHVDLSSAGKLVKRGKVAARDIVRSPAILEFAGIFPAPNQKLEGRLSV